jgi:soluble lytic murein transglycosylase-like protein
MFAPRRFSAAGRSSASRRLTILLLTGLLSADIFSCVAQAQTSSAEAPLSNSPYAGFVAEAARRTGVPEQWIWAVMRVESRGRLRAISPKGAMGLMQIMPATWADLRIRHRLGSDPYNPRDNILAGAAYLREMHERYGAPGFLAAYNAGPGRYDDYVSSGRPLPAETIAYVAQIAPLIGSEPLAQRITVAAADTLAWTRAPLFIARNEGGGGATAAHEAEPSGDDRVPKAAQARDVAEPRTGGLFVARSADGGFP